MAGTAFSLAKDVSGPVGEDAFSKLTSKNSAHLVFLPRCAVCLAQFSQKLNAFFFHRIVHFYDSTPGETACPPTNRGRDHAPERLSNQASRERPVSGHGQVRESVENVAPSACPLRARTTQSDYFFSIGYELLFKGNRRRAQ
jgi:hypothetical protein